MRSSRRRSTAHAHNLDLRFREREFDFLGGHLYASVYTLAGQAKTYSECVYETKLYYLATNKQWINSQTARPDALSVLTNKKRWLVHHSRLEEQHLNIEKLTALIVVMPIYKLTKLNMYVKQ